ncbi:MAG: 4Fe-4S dicluster domain-containing protein [Acidobacteriota bacterium]
MKVLPVSKIEEALNILSKDAEVYAPIWRGQMSGYYKWIDDADDQLVMEAVNTYLSPKNIVIPQTEKMYSFNAPGNEATVTEVADQSAERILFGVKPCDIKAIDALDMVFLTKGFVDDFYKIKRDKTTIISRVCYQPGAACFCESMGVDRMNPNADVFIHDIGNQNYAWEAKTPKGEAVTAKIAGLFEEKDAAMPKFLEMKRTVNVEGLAEKLKASFEHEAWESLSSRCMTCGVCSNVCPSCYCFDIQVRVWGDEGYRFRCWDSCMYREYSQMAGGHNPRDAKKERFRNRFLHKLEFFNERYGTALCTGCGRCVAMCPNMVNIVEVIKAFEGVQVDV